MLRVERRVSGEAEADGLPAARWEEEGEEEGEEAAADLAVASFFLLFAAATCAAAAFFCDLGGICVWGMGGRSDCKC